jgi:ABC-type glycerol-3-phosphate transport system permease component
MPKPIPQKILLLGVLLIGAIIFALPYVNMVFTSVKMEDELSNENFAFFPRAPIPRTASPYAMADTPFHIHRPSDMSRENWDNFKDPFHAAVKSAIENWWADQPFLQQAFNHVDQATAFNSLTEVVGSSVLMRISDEARKKGPAAMLAEVPRLTTPDKIRDVFNDYVPRFSLGDVTVRLTNYSKRLAGNGHQWKPASKNDELFPLQPPVAKPGQLATLLRYNSPDHSPISATLTPPAVPTTQSPPPATRSAQSLPPLTSGEASMIDRVYIFVQPDQSWSRLDILITLDGRQYRLAESIYAATRTWTYLELRIPGHEEMPPSGRTFYLLQDAGSAPANAPPFAVTLSLLPSSQTTAWWAKISRNYLTAFRQVPITRYIATSVSLAILTILLTTFGSSLSAYAFARLDFPGRNLLFGILLATMMIPGQVTMIPSFLIHTQLGWYNTLYPLWVHAAFGSAFFIFMMRQFFLAIPKELEDAARIDGCGFFGIYWHVMLPLVRPTLITVAIFAFMASWNNFMGPLIYVNDERLYNLAFGLFKFNLTSATNPSLIMAGSFIMTLPIIALFFLFQRYFIQGISLTGLGGR